ncbi:POU domain, class 4, transcription factor 2 [Chiloscyllium plagiosum]|uniref:POU domain, class 4, transcription factor 2 n=1 Tax=Chiloscyllium plagiosum TaxID=36176 RepID=UPI001CB7DABB|nr:POU domain, class 4, transcription factor 2 [Chiloscyllium plagiosum]
MMMMMPLNGKQAFGMPPPSSSSSLAEPKYSSLHSSPASNLSSSPSSSSGGGSSNSSSETMCRVYLPTAPQPHAHPHHHQHHQQHHQQQQHPPPQNLDGELLEHMSPGLGLPTITGPDGSVVSPPPPSAPPPPPPPHMAAINHMHQAMSLAAAAAAAHGHAHGHGHGLASPHGGLAPGCLGEVDADPRDLEAFAERFKQRRIKLGVTQADVGSALANLKIPGVGSLSQSTICRFESLTLSHNNMIALKPILQAWLEEAEKSHREKLSKPELFNGADKKRKRTSIAAPEKRSLEAYFAIQPRPSSEKIAAIAEKLDLKKNVVRVWFCNQRQKQKRMKYSAGH